MKLSLSKVAFPVAIAAAAMVAPSVGFAAPVTGDEFTVTVTEQNIPVNETGSGFAGQGTAGFGIDVSFSFGVADTRVVDVLWRDEDTFQIKW